MKLLNNNNKRLKSFQRKKENCAGLEPTLDATLIKMRTISTLKKLTLHFVFVPLCRRPELRRGSTLLAVGLTAIHFSVRKLTTETNFYTVDRTLISTQ